MKVTKHRVTRPDEETLCCCSCGEPFQADRAEPGEPDWSVFYIVAGRACCSRACAESVKRSLSVADVSRASRQRREDKMAAWRAGQ